MMTKTLNAKHLFAIALLSVFNASSVVVAEEISDIAPEATATEIEMPFRDVPLLEDAFIDTSPADRNDGIVVGERHADGDDKDPLVQLAEEIADGQHDNFDSLLVAHKGKLLFESYYLKGRVDLPHPQASATKTYTAMALGRAIQLGYLTMADLDKPLISFFDELDPETFTEGAELITLQNALTMTTGIRIPEEQREDFRQNAEQIQGRKQVQAILEHSAPITTESQSFQYGTGPDLIMQVIDAASPGSAEEFIEDELLNKIGISNYAWSTSPSGLPEAGWRTSMTSRDMIKWGILVAGKGRWNGEQLISEAYINKAVSRLINVGDEDVFGGGPDIFNQGYGYFMWNADMRVGDQIYYSTSAQGGGGQFIILVEELDLIVVTTSHERNPSTLQLTAERILPAFIQ